jgi:hypothetical protein
MTYGKNNLAALNNSRLGEALTKLGFKVSGMARVKITAVKT